MVSNIIIISIFLFRETLFYDVNLILLQTVRLNNKKNWYFSSYNNSFDDIL